MAKKKPTVGKNFVVFPAYLDDIELALTANTWHKVEFSIKPTQDTNFSLTNAILNGVGQNSSANKLFVDYAVLTRDKERVKDILDEMVSNPDDYDTAKIANEIDNLYRKNYAQCVTCGVDTRTEFTFTGKPHICKIDGKH